MLAPVARVSTCCIAEFILRGRPKVAGAAVLADACRFKSAFQQNEFCATLGAQPLTEDPVPQNYRDTFD
jgi:hypothetical protein